MERSESNEKVPTTSTTTELVPYSKKISYVIGQDFEKMEIFFGKDFYVAFNAKDHENKIKELEAQRSFAQSAKKAAIALVLDTLISKASLLDVALDKKIIEQIRELEDLSEIESVESDKLNGTQLIDSLTVKNSEVKKIIGNELDMHKTGFLFIKSDISFDEETINEIIKIYKSSFLRFCKEKFKVSERLKQLTPRWLFSNEKQTYMNKRDWLFVFYEEYKAKFPALKPEKISIKETFFVVLNYIIEMAKKEHEITKILNEKNSDTTDYRRCLSEEYNEKARNHKATSIIEADKQRSNNEEKVELALEVMEPIDVSQYSLIEIMKPPEIRSHLEKLASKFIAQDENGKNQLTYYLHALDWANTKGKPIKYINDFLNDVLEETKGSVSLSSEIAKYNQEFIKSLVQIVAQHIVENAHDWAESPNKYQEKAQEIALGLLESASIKKKPWFSKYFIDKIKVNFSRGFTLSSKDLEKIAEDFFTCSYVSNIIGNDNLDKLNLNFSFEERNKSLTRQEMVELENNRNKTNSRNGVEENKRNTIERFNKMKGSEITPKSPYRNISQASLKAESSTSFTTNAPFPSENHPKKPPANLQNDP